MGEIGLYLADVHPHTHTPDPCEHTHSHTVTGTEVASNRSNVTGVWLWCSHVKISTRTHFDILLLPYQHQENFKVMSETAPVHKLNRMP